MIFLNKMGVIISQHVLKFLEAEDLLSAYNTNRITRESVKCYMYKIGYRWIGPEDPIITKYMKPLFFAALNLGVEIDFAAFAEQAHIRGDREMVYFLLKNILVNIKPMYGFRQFCILCPLDEDDTVWARTVIAFRFSCVYSKNRSLDREGKKMHPSPYYYPNRIIFRESPPFGKIRDRTHYKRA